MGKTQYSIIVPLFNEELVIGESYRRIKEVMDQTNESYEIVFINDGSRDQTENIAKEICQKDKNIKLISFSRNFGHQPAITAGMNEACGNAIIIIDADLQDPPAIMHNMIEKWKEGYDVVYGKRSKRAGETIFKRISAKIYYRLLSSITDVQIPVDVGDFRLIDRSVCDALNRLPEKNRYVRGLVSWVGFKQTFVEFEREERLLGETKYPLRKMIKLALDGITSFSNKPLKLASTLGYAVSALGFIYLIVILFQRIFTDTTITGWTSIIALLLILNGVTLIMLGVLGEYIGRIYDEMKARPVYIIKEKIGFEDTK
ncbi:MAG: glycosyltransferase [Firmicutes bacterium HGW-Firmicutes-1]|jgi:dolichol-phosphate mannosyltransferase|nr:MAG: glycosyltransferase [Firmicutes bacterium HGW-Firmicutes-1]